MDAEPNMIKAALNSVTGSILLAMITAIIRVTYDGKERRWQRKLLEALFCGFITLGFILFSTAMDWSPAFNGFIGSAVGSLGSNWVREKAKLLADKKIGK